MSEQTKQKISENIVREAGVMAREWKLPPAERVVSIPTFAELRML